MIKAVLITKPLCLILLFIIISGSTSDINHKEVQLNQFDFSSGTQIEGGKEVNLYDLREYIPQNPDNLKGIDKLSGKKNIEMVLANVCDYPKKCEQFIFLEKYADFELVEQSTSDIIANAYYRHKNNPILGDEDASVSIYIYETRDLAHKLLINSLDSYASDTVLPISTTGICVGDLGIGSPESLVFIRGNVFVDINGYDNISIVSMAQEIDSQILKIITE